MPEYVDEFRIEVTVGHAPLFKTEWLEPFARARRIVHDLLPLYGPEFIYFSHRVGGHDVQISEPVASIPDLLPQKYLPREVIDV